MTYESKRTGYGYVEIKDASTAGWYALYIDGKLIAQSPDYGFILSEYNKY